MKRRPSPPPSSVPARSPVQGRTMPPSRPTSRCCARIRADFNALNELATLAWAGGYRSAARTAYTQAVAHHPDNVVARVNLGNLLREEQDVAGARAEYEAALALDPRVARGPPGHGLGARRARARRRREHRRRGFTGRLWSRSPIAARGRAYPSSCSSRRAAAISPAGCGSTIAASPFMRSTRITSIRLSRCRRTRSS
jgi:tetratricopeptide (TPR) repeat protein